jgi:hypothetical protein
MNSTTCSLHPAPPTTTANQHFFQSFKKCKVDITTPNLPQKKKKHGYEYPFKLLKLQLKDPQPNMLEDQPLRRTLHMH